jgi:hypothetical protein
MALEEKIRELIAVGASIAANNPPEVKYRIARARELGADDAALNDAVEIGQLVRRGAASKTDVFALSLATTPPQRERGGCRKGGAGRGNGQANSCGGGNRESEPVA